MGQRNNIPVIAQHTGADSASVIYDAIEAARSRGADVLIADTAGRLQNKSNLMEELKKVVRVMKKLDDAAPHEIMLTLDAGTGQNALSQAKLFSEAVGLTGITLTKLDGTAKAASSSRWPTSSRSRSATSGGRGDRRSASVRRQRLHRGAFQSRGVISFAMSKLGRRELCAPNPDPGRGWSLSGNRYDPF